MPKSDSSRADRKVGHQKTPERFFDFVAAGAEIAPIKNLRPLRSEDVTLLRYDDFFASKPVVFSATFCEKSKKSQPLRMTRAALAPSEAG